MTKCNSVHCMTALGLDLSIHFSDKHKNTNTNAKTKMHKYKLTKCPSVHGMTALGCYLPLHSSVARGRPTAVQQGGRRHARTFKDLTEAGR